ncbi:VOC family protein [Rhizobium laguerreae]|uniref:VOC family protein n=1 Tax=Rhizobium laguerreae TaxID=1076926 RepID=UPI0021B09E76|nr:VOC family protein [Rhizobium laguerreae]
MAEDEGGLGYGSGTFHFSVQVPIDGKPATVGNGTHIAFAVEDRSMVNQFYAAALKYGGSDDGAPGLRPSYDANYYGAFVRDPDGHKIEAVTYSAN